MELHTENEGLAARNQRSKFKWDFLPDFPFSFFFLDLSLVLSLCWLHTELGYMQKLRIAIITSLKSRSTHPPLSCCIWNKLKGNEKFSKVFLCVYVFPPQNTDIYKKCFTVDFEAFSSCRTAPSTLLCTKGKYTKIWCFVLQKLRLTCSPH